MMKILNRHRYKTIQGFFTGLVSLIMVTALILALHGGALADSPSITEYTAFPPIGGKLLKPNVLINLDTSYSMFYFAYDFSYNSVTDIGTYSITATADPGGTITPPGDVGGLYGNDHSFLITADSGYEIADVLVDGSSVGNAAGTLTYTFMFNNVGFNHTISVSFALAMFGSGSGSGSTDDGGVSSLPVSKGFKGGKTYYGYFESGKMYEYDSAINEFKVNETTGQWDGDFLNWLTMRRADIIKKALVGGKTNVRISGPAAHDHDLLGQQAWIQFEGYQKQVGDLDEDGNCNGLGEVDPGSYTPYSCALLTFTFNNKRDMGKANSLDVNDIAAFSLGTSYDSSNFKRVVVHRASEPEGVIQTVSKNARLGLEFISDKAQYDAPTDCLCMTSVETYDGKGGGKKSNLSDVQGGTVVVPCGYYDNNVTVTINGTAQTIPRKDAMVKLIANNIPLTPATPLAESLWTATGYFSQDPSGVDPVGPNYTGSSYPVGDAVDPYNYADDPTTDKRMLPCAKSYVITITDGEPTQDMNIDSGRLSDTSNTTYTDDINNPLPTWRDEANNYFWDSFLGGSHFVDEVALYGHIDIANNDYRDLRTDLGVDNNGDGKDDDPQYLTHYFIRVFGSGTPDAERLLNWSKGWIVAGGGGAARNGGFIDSGGNFEPDQMGEYNSDGDEFDDTYYEAEDGYQLEAALISAIYTAFKRASSGTAASIITNTAQGEGAVYQTYFYPERFENNGIRKWLGYIHALFVDKYGNLRDDAGTAGKLDDADPVIKMDYSPVNGTEIYKCATTDNGKTYSCSSSPEADGLDSIKPIWDGGRWLWDNPAASRSVYTTTDGSTMIDFVDTANLSALQPHLRAADNDATYTETKNIINWIRGDDLTGTTDSGHPDGYRQRSLTLTINGSTATNVWKLGDIIYSSPTAVGKPMENYDLLYGDSSYTEFRLDKLKRRQVVYTGGNDGMLHAFNAGCYDETNRKFDNTACVDGETYDLGQEIWAFIPRGLLPHLKWLTDPDYTHVYYVDLKPKITDVQIFDCNDGVHVGENPNTNKCWGTILIGGFRYGGKDISWTSGGAPYSASPEYFALDITDPSTPRLLWTFANPVTALNPAGLGLSMSYPAVAKTGNNWYAVFGSGAVDYEITSELTGSQNGNVFVVEISGGNNGGINDIDWKEDTNFRKIPTTIPNTFMADPITVDVDIDYDVDVIYIGGNNNNPNALMYRITTGPTMAQWKLSTLGDINIIAGANDVVKRITSAPSAAMDDSANLWVFFGTGQFLGASDKNRTDTGAFYGIKDGCWDGTCTAPAKAFNNLHDASAIDICVGGGVACGGTKFSVVEADVAAKDGWAIYFNLRGELADFTGANFARNGERVFSKPLVLGGLVSWGSYIPGENECSSSEGESKAYSVYYKTGTAYKEYVFDEQKAQAIPSDVVARVIIWDNPEPPSSPTAQITSEGTVNIIFQGGASVSGIKDNTPLSIRSGVAGCKDEQIP